MSDMNGGYGSPQNPYDGSPNVYGQPYGSPYPVVQEHPQGTVILVLGILGFVTSGICGVIAWVMGHRAEKQIAASGLHYSNEQNIKVGKILGMVTTIIGIIIVAIWIVAIVGLFAVGASGSN